METLRIRERDGEFKVEKIVTDLPSIYSQAYRLDFETKKVLWWTKQVPVLVPEEVENIGWETALFFNEEGGVTTYRYFFSEYSFIQLQHDPAIFESKEHAIEWIEHFWGQQYTLEDGEWRTI